MRRFQRDPRLPFQEVEGEAVIVVPGRRELHQLDEVGTFLWNALKEPRTLEDLVGEVCEGFEVEAGVAERDIREFLEKLEGKGLLRAS